MNTKTFFLLAIFACVVSLASASKVYTVSNNDWSDAWSWNTNQVPSNPDTIVIRHYITFSQSLSIAAPTVLLIEAGGTLCGDYELNINCGARFLNYGHVYVNSSKIRDGANYNEFFAKTQMTITGCNMPGYGTGFINYAPNGVTKVWPPVLCKTSSTNWESGGTATALESFFEDNVVSLYPNPVQHGLLSVSASKEISLEMFDLHGRQIWSGQNLSAYTIDMHLFSPGIYFLKISQGGRQITKKIINQ